jgi:hypothetical protein
MKIRFGAALALAATLVLGALVSSAADADPLWQQLPPTPSMPQPPKSGYAPVNGIRMYYAVYGHGSPVILLRGGLANSNYWGNQVPELAKHYEV